MLIYFLILIFVLLFNNINADFIDHHQFIENSKTLSTSNDDVLLKIDLNKFTGNWNVLYSINDSDNKSIKKCNLKNCNSRINNINKCESFYFYFDDSRQFAYKFNRKNIGSENIHEKSGLIHLKNNSINHIWNIKDNNDINNDFFQIILYVDENYHFSIVSDEHLKRINIIIRPSFTENIEESFIDTILTKNNLSSLSNFDKLYTSC